ncbi:MAG: PhzF family phenazine biosynthesis protein [Selenomonadaceae bacterium]|nr:PhzF family phenazine biosynthesis protein [Selenomonadaceae bacterium]MBQ3727054.1 PhzF family phenazine biosynthesis protein [Selenomonadaceae bacterium]MBQ9498086.1 PhzF family phenazine biosynthesis protein [Selenomonadaceae bacterium]
MKQYIVDAFTEKIFGGNPAAVCVLEKFPSEELMLNIARENNLSETAFAVREENFYRLRWFTPSTEIDFCGHATLATAFVILTQAEKNSPRVEFETLSGRFTVERRGKFFEMNLPAYTPKKIPVTDAMSEALGARVLEAYLARDLLMILESAAAVENLSPDMNKLSNLDGMTQAVTAAGENFDCVSRVFAPKIKIPEDPVTGSTHCLIAPYWSERLGKKKLIARQASARGGILHCEVLGARVKISGSAILFAVSDLKV